MSATVTTEKVWGRAWHLGDALWWRNDDGVYGIVLTEELEYGPRGALKRKGLMASIHGATLTDVNLALKGLGFGRVGLRLKDIKWNEDRGERPKGSPQGAQSHRGATSTLPPTLPKGAKR